MTTKMRSTKGGILVPEDVRSEFEKKNDAIAHGIDDTTKKVADKDLEEMIEVFKDKTTNWEVHPIRNEIFFTPYPQSPYENPVSKGGLLLKRDVKYDEKADVNKDLSDERFIAVGFVLEVGDGCAYVKPGMDIMYYNNVDRMLPIDPDGTGDLPFRAITENNVVAISTKKQGNEKSV